MLFLTKCACNSVFELLHLFQTFRQSCLVTGYKLVLDYIHFCSRTVTVLFQIHFYWVVSPFDIYNFLSKKFIFIFRFIEIFRYLKLNELRSKYTLQEKNRKHSDFLNDFLYLFLHQNMFFYKIVSLLDISSLSYHLGLRNSCFPWLSWCYNIVSLWKYEVFMSKIVNVTPTTKIKIWYGNWHMKLNKIFLKGATSQLEELQLIKLRICTTIVAKWVLNQSKCTFNRI